MAYCYVICFLPLQSLVNAGWIPIHLNLSPGPSSLILLILSQVLIVDIIIMIIIIIINIIININTTIIIPWLKW